MLRALATVLLFLVTTVFAAVIHLPSSHGRGAARDIANAILHQQFKGHLHLGSVDVLSPRSGLRVSNVTLRDEQGRIIIDGGTLTAGALSDVFRTLLGRPNSSMPALMLHARALNLLFDQGNVPSIASAFDPRPKTPTVPVTPSRPRTPAPPRRETIFRFPSIRVAIDRVTLDHPAFPSTIDHPTVETHLVSSPVHIDSQLQSAVVQSTQYGSVNADAHFNLDIPRQTETGPDVPFNGRMHADASLRGAEIDCTVNLDLDADGTRISADGCTARAPFLSRIAGTELTFDAAISRVRFRVRPDGALELTASVAAGGQPLDVTLTGTRDSLQASVRVAGLNLARVRNGLPVSDATGEIRVTRRGEQLELDTTQLRAVVNGVEIPTVRARARLTADNLAIDDVDAPLLGLHAHGNISLRDPTHPVDVEAEGNVQNADAIPMLRQFGVAGSVRYSARIRQQNGTLTASYTAHGRSVRAPGNVRVGSAQLSGDFTRTNDGAMHTRSRAQFSGLVASGFGPLSGSVDVDGDPTAHLAGNFRVNADGVSAIGGDDLRGHTATSGRFVFRRSADGIDLDVPDARVAVRGAAGALRASVRTRQGRRPVVVASLTTAEGSRANVTVDAAGIHAEVASLSLPWVSRALGLKRPLDGQLTGNIGLHQNHPSGSLDWTGGSLPVLGPVTVHIDSSQQRGRDQITGRLRYGDAGAAQPEVSVAIQARIGSIRGGSTSNLLRAVDSVDIRAARTPVAILQQFAPPGVVLNGGGDLQLTAARPDPSAPLETKLAFDIRHAQVGASLEAAVARSLLGRALTSGSGRSRPLTIPFRLRGALCATLPDATDVPQRTDFAVAFGSDTPRGEIELPRTCALADSQFATSLLKTEGETAGPWFFAVDAMRRELNSFRGSGKAWTYFNWSEHATELLRAASVNINVQAGPLTNQEWPFTPTVGRLVPALARPNLPGRVTLSTRVNGSMFRPDIHTTTRLELAAGEWIEGDRHATLDVSADLTGAGGDRALIQRAVFDVDAQLNISAAERNEEPIHAVFELRTILDPRELASGREAIQHVDIERLSARTASFDLQTIPWARRHRVSGRLALSLTDTENVDRPLLLNASIRDWRVRDQRGSNVAFRAGIYNACTLPGAREACTVPRWETKTCFTVSPEDQGVAGCDPTAVADNTPTRGLRVIAGAPFEGHWKSGQLLFAKTRAAMHALNFPIETISPLLETGSIVRIGGELTAGVGWDAQTPRSVNGFLFWHHGELTLERMGTPIREIDLSLAAAGRRIYFSPELTMQMGVGSQQGSATADGMIDLSGSQGEIARVVLRPVLTNLPAVQEGNLFAQITGSLSFDGRLYKDHLDSTLTINRATLQIPEDSSRSLQSLDDAYGVFVMGRSLVSRPAQTRSFDTRINYRTVEPIILRRRDFLIGVRAEGWIRYANSLGVAGTVDLAGPGNFFELFGKRFAIERLNILLDGSSSLDPLLDVALRYESPSDGRINILVGGRKSAPEIRFSAERYPGASEAEILAILILGRRESRGATDQAAIETQGRQAAVSLITGILYGLGAGQIQRVVESTGFGFVPTLIAEPGADGTGLSRLGVGVLPSFFGNRVYIEGTANFNNITGNGGQVLVDATISEHLSLGALWNQSASTGQRFGVDFFVTP